MCRFYEVAVLKFQNEDDDLLDDEEYEQEWCD